MLSTSKKIKGLFVCGGKGKSLGVFIKLPISSILIVPKDEIPNIVPNFWKTQQRPISRNTSKPVPIQLQTSFGCWLKITEISVRICPIGSAQKLGIVFEYVDLRFHGILKNPTDIREKARTNLLHDPDSSSIELRNLRLACVSLSPRYSVGVECL